MREIAGLSEVLDRFDGILIDQFGVLHDGRAAFPEAIGCLDHVAARGLPIAALSNSGKRAVLNADRLDRLGFRRDLFAAVVTSGELAHRHIGVMLSDGRLKPGAGVAILSRDGDASAIEGYDLRRVDPADGPSLLLIAGAEPERCTRDEYRTEIAPLAEADVPAFCINPDRHIYADGARAFGPGLIAEDYRAAGGTVTMLGKPGAEMFAAGRAALGDPDPARVLMIGDSLEHDIAGGREAGCATLWTRGGVQSGGDAAQSDADFTMHALRY